MSFSIDFSNVCASVALSPLAATGFGIGIGMAVILAVTLFKCARGTWKLITHH
jgi:hypothetical protein